MQSKCRLEKPLSEFGNAEIIKPYKPNCKSCLEKSLEKTVSVSNELPYLPNSENKNVFDTFKLMSIIKSPTSLFEEIVKNCIDFKGLNINVLNQCLKLI